MKLENTPILDYSPYESLEPEIHKNEILVDFLEEKHKDFLQKATKKYWYWSELKYQRYLPYDNAEKAWELVKFQRTLKSERLQFGNESFSYFLTPDIQKKLHEFDLNLIGGLYKNPITETDKTQYIQESLLEEAITSSQIEGAATTTKVAVKMLKSEREPRNESEQMIFNNLRTINFIVSQADKDLTIDLIIELHEMMTVKTKAESCAGSFRTKAIFVQDTITGERVHTAPHYEQLKYLMNDFCDFANAEEPFVHPIVKASILHFMIGYIHPFEDGNGRTARVLFYWFLIKKGYVLMKNISISKAILKTRRQYDKAFLKTEKDNNDLTYFIIYSIKTLNIAFENLLKYRDEKKNEAEKRDLMAYKLEQKGLNKRQASLVAYLYAKKDAEINLTSFAEKHDVVRQTARKDINKLKKIALIKEEKDGRNVYFSIVSKEKIERFLNG